MRIPSILGMTVALLTASYATASEPSIHVTTPYSQPAEDFRPRHFTDTHPARRRFIIKRGIETSGPAGTRLSIRPMKGGAFILFSVDPNARFLK